MRTWSRVSSWSRSPAKQFPSRARSPDRCIRGAVGSRLGDRPSSLRRRAVTTQSADWAGFPYLVLMGAAFGELALWVVRWWVSVGVRRRSGGDAMVQRREGTRHPASRMDTSSQGAQHVRSVTGCNRTAPDRGCPGRPRRGRPGHRDQARSNRSRFMTLFHAATKSAANFSGASSLA